MWKLSERLYFPHYPGQSTNPQCLYFLTLPWLVQWGELWSVFQAEKHGLRIQCGGAPSAYHDER